jgi:hypothetical protein
MDLSAVNMEPEKTARPPATRSGGNSRVEILPKRPTAERGGGSPARTC